MIAELRVIASAWLGWLADAVNPAPPIRPPWPEDQPLGEWPPIVPAAGAGPPAGGGHLTDRMRDAAHTLTELNGIYRLNSRATWSPEELISEIPHVAADYPNR